MGCMGIHLNHLNFLNHSNIPFDDYNKLPPRCVRCEMLRQLFQGAVLESLEFLRYLPCHAGLPVFPKCLCKLTQSTWKPHGTLINDYGP